MKPKYLFFTYGARGLRGIQIRAIRVAKYFKKEEVIFWNGNDNGDLIKRSGFAVKNVSLSLIELDKIQIPDSVEVVIFADIPTNEFFQFSLFIKAKKEGKKIVIFDQIYRRGQTNEFVYKKLAEESDVFFLNGLSFLKSEEKGNFKVIPPLIESDIPENPKQYLAQKYNIPEDKPWIFGIGYHEKVRKKLEQLGKKLYEKGVDFHLIYTNGPNYKMESSSYITRLPYLINGDFFAFIKASEMTLIKFGFLQLTEIITLETHPIILGEGGYILQKKNVMDNKIWDAVYYSEKIDENLQNHIMKFLSDKNYRKKYIDILKTLHNGETKGGRIAADYIKNLRKNRSALNKEKNLVIFINDEFMKFENFIKKNCGNLYPIVFICSSPDKPFTRKKIDESLLSLPINSLILKSEEIIPHSFKEVYIFARRKYDSFLDIIPWYELWIKRLILLLQEANTIYLTEKGRSMLKSFLLPYKDKIKILEK